MKKDVVLNFSAHFSNYCKSYFSTTQIKFLNTNSFKYMMSEEAAVQVFRNKSVYMAKSDKLLNSFLFCVTNHALKLRYMLDYETINNMNRS